MKKCQIFHNRDAESDANTWMGAHPTVEILDVKVIERKPETFFSNGTYPTVTIIYEGVE